MAKTVVLARAVDSGNLECIVSTAGGKTLRLSGPLDEVHPAVEGDPALAGNPALIDNSWAFTKFKYLTISLPSVEEQESAKKQAAAFHGNAKWIAELLDEYDNMKLLAWCSACFEKVEHQQVVRPFGQLSTFLCTNCGSSTTPCLGVGCKNMAVRPPRAFKLPQYCAEHRHDIPGFEKAAKKLESLEDYAQLLKFDKPKLARINKYVSLTAAGLMVGVTAGISLAPAVGGAIGALVGGYSGAAATSYGLAMLGGGSLAMGGLGMAGGTYVVTAFGAALGSALGLSITSAYVNQDKSFWLEKLRDGTGPTVLFSSGFLTQSRDSWSGWQPIVDELYPEAPVYRVHWGAKELKQLGFVAGGNILQLVVNQGMKNAAAKAAKMGAKKLGPLGMILAAADLIKNPWHVAKNRADKTGAILSDILSRSNEEEFILMGHSLGARVMTVAAQGLGSKPDAPKVRDVHLFGAAIGANGDWHTLNNGIENLVHNYFSRNDNVLKYLFTATQLGQSPAGLIGFQNALPKINNIDVSDSIERHSGYFVEDWVDRNLADTAETVL